MPSATPLLDHWARRARRKPSFFQDERGASTATASNVAGDVGSYLAGCATQLRQLEGYKEIATELDALVPHPTSQVDLDALEQRLCILDAKLAAIAQSRQNAEDVSQLAAELKLELAPYRTRMTAAQFTALESQYHSKLLFEQAGLPRLGLFYMRENLSRAA